MRTWKRVDGRYVSNMGEVIEKIEQRVSYVPVGGRLAIRSCVEKYYTSPQAKNKFGRIKFDTLKEAKAFFDKED